MCVRMFWCHISTLKPIAPSHTILLEQSPSPLSTVALICAAHIYKDIYKNLKCTRLDLSDSHRSSLYEEIKMYYIKCEDTYMGIYVCIHNNNDDLYGAVTKPCCNKGASHIN